MLGTQNTTEPPKQSLSFHNTTINYFSVNLFKLVFFLGFLAIKDASATEAQQIWITWWLVGFVNRNVQREIMSPCATVLIRSGEKQAQSLNVRSQPPSPAAEGDKKSPVNKPKRSHSKLMIPKASQNIPHLAFAVLQTQARSIFQGEQMSSRALTLRRRCHTAARGQSDSTLLHPGRPSHRGGVFNTAVFH